MHRVLLDDDNDDDDDDNDDEDGDEVDDDGAYCHEAYYPIREAFQKISQCKL